MQFGKIEDLLAFIFEVQRSNFRDLNVSHEDPDVDDALKGLAAEWLRSGQPVPRNIQLEWTKNILRQHSLLFYKEWGTYEDPLRPALCR